MQTAKNLGVGFACFMGYVLVLKYVVKPVSVKFAVPVLKDL